MDDLRMVRELLPPAPVPPQAVAQARRRLDDLVRQSAVPAVSAVPTESHRSRPRTGRRAALILTAAAMVGGIVAVGLPALTADAPETGTPPTAAPVDLSAKGVLLVAAEREDRAAAAGGRYWRVRSLTGHTMLRVGTGKNRYTLEERTVYESWTAAQPSGTSWFGVRNIGARPASPADEAAWRRDGSPRRWDLGPSDTSDRHHLFATVAPQRGRLSRIQGDSTFPVGGIEGLTLAQVRALPADPAGLRAYLLGVLARVPEGRGDAAERIDPDSWLFGSASSLLATTPAPPQVRAAAFRLLAGLPDVRSIGRVADSLGRTGVGVVLTQRSSGGSADLTLVIDPDSGRLLGQRLTGPKRVYTAILAAEWTDDRPTAPPAQAR